MPKFDDLPEDKAGAAYWERVWSAGVPPPPYDPADTRLGNTTIRMLDRHFSHWLPGAGATLIEAGCGGSRFLGYFAQRFGLRVSGLDYAASGVESAQAILTQAGIKGDIHKADLFAPPMEFVSHHDVVFSAGLVEHFQPTAPAVAALAQLVRPGGLVITLIPNMCGSVGLLQRFVDREVWRLHVPLDPAQLAQAHHDAGLDVLTSCYLGTVDWSVVNFNGVHARPKSRLMGRLAWWASKLVWLVWRLGLPETASRVASPYCLCVARRRDDASGTTG